MTKEQFIKKLNTELSFLSPEELENRLAFYSEMIDDRIEEGLSEEDAIAEIGDVDEIIAQLKADGMACKKHDSSNPYSNGTYEDPKSANSTPSKKKKTSAWAIVLISVGSPLWITLAIAAIAVILSVYIVIWAVVGSLWAIPIALVCACIGGMITGVALLATGSTLLGITLIGAAMACIGIAIFAGFGCYYLMRPVARLSKAIARLFIRKEKKDA